MLGDSFSLGGKDFLQGVRAASGVAIGYVPIGMAYGILAKAVGLSLFETVGMSLMVYAGASQFVALNLIAMGLNPAQIVFTVFMVNFRHFLMSTSLREKIGTGNRAVEALYSFGVTDETFAVSSVEERELTALFMVGLNFTAYLSWAGSSGAGYALGRGLPEVLQASMSIALYALFIGLLVPSIKERKEVLFVAGLAGGLNSAFRLGLSTGWSIVLASLISAAAGTFIFRSRRKGDEENEGDADV